MTRGTQGVVTQVYRNVVHVRITFSDGEYVLAILREYIDAPNGETYEAVPKPKPEPEPPVRKLGTPPEGMIAPDDPRIAWFWQDAEKLANRMGYCDEYDEITDKLNIPGRMREHRVEITVNGLKVVTHVQARSQKEADALVAEKLGGAA